ncbi:MAG: glycosyltransferase family 2 protein [Pyrinomonadaceae bacterium]|nr:glycosyltransferase family 2 protein [Pyrinomonadaceae bacterium]
MDSIGGNKVSTNPLVSVVIIFLNAERFMEEAIESVFAQTYENWELLLVDDGSNDGSTRIARQYAEAHPGKVSYLEHAGHQNRGMSASRNLGISYARGSYVALLDSDDVWLSHKLRRQVDILDSYPEAGLVYGLSRYWSSWTGESEDAERDSVPELGISANTLYEPPALLTLLYPLANARPPCTSNLMFRRNIAERLGGYEESFTGALMMYEDQGFLTKMYLKEAVFVSEECWDLYRLHPDSCVSKVSKAGQYYRVRLSYLEWFAGYLLDQGVKDPRIWKLLREEQRIARLWVHLRERAWWRAMLGALILLRYHPRRCIGRLRALILSPRAKSSPSSWNPYAGELSG